jgi:glycosyltransferase involved in cell wall biosynthesis
MRILVITNFFPPHDVGGAEIAAYNTCHGLLKRGVDTSVLSIHTRGPKAQDRRYELEGVRVHQVGYPPHPLKRPFLQIFDPRVYRAVAAEIQHIQPDLVHVHNISGATLAPFVACRRLNVPLVLTLHDHWLLCPNNMLYKNDGELCDPAEQSGNCGRCFRRYDFWGNVPWRRQIFSYLVENVRYFISPSQKLVELHVAAGYDRARFRVVPYGIKPTLFHVPSDPLVRKTVREHGLFHSLLFAGAVAETKGVQTLIEALPILRKHVDRLRLVVAGVGDEQLMNALRRYDYHTVRMLGRVPFLEMRALYATADLTVTPSTWYDNSPMVIYESLMAGTPVLGSAIGGIPELIEEGKTGYIFPPGDAVALAEGVIRHFALSAYERRAMRQRCAAYARAHMTMEHHLDRLQQVYDEALQARDRAALPITEPIRKSKNEPVIEVGETQ